MRTRTLLLNHLIEKRGIDFEVYDRIEKYISNNVSPLMIGILEGDAINQVAMNV